MHVYPRASTAAGRSQTNRIHEADNSTLCWESPEQIAFFSSQHYSHNSEVHLSKSDPLLWHSYHRNSDLAMAFFDNFGASLAGTVAAVGNFTQNQLGPTLNEAGKGLGVLGGPAMEVAGKALEFGKDRLGPVLAPVMGEFSKALNHSSEELLSGAWSFVKSNPWTTMWYGFNVATMFGPHMVWMPPLRFLGFGVNGVRAGKSSLQYNPQIFVVKDTTDKRLYLGSLAATLQSWLGPVVANSWFAGSQSAVMGGYGVGFWDGVVRAGSATLGVVRGAARFRGSGTPPGEGEKTVEASAEGAKEEGKKEL